METGVEAVLDLAAGHGVLVICSHEQKEREDHTKYPAHEYYLDRV